MGCEYPRLRTKFLPCISARYPTPLISKILSKPVLTPVTIFWMRARVVPCNARWVRSSDGRLTFKIPFSRDKEISGWNEYSRAPFGPFTLIIVPSMCTSTWGGITTGKRPILDISYSLPDLAQDLATHTKLAGALTSHDTFRCGKNGNTHTGEDPRDLLFSRVHAASRAAESLQTGDDCPALTTFAYIFQTDA